MRFFFYQLINKLTTFRFILSYEDNNSLFIVSPELDYTIFHIIAQCYSTSKQYPRLIDMVVQKYGSREHLEARANNPAKSTALFTAVAQLNPVVIEALVNAGASMTDTDSEGRTPLQYARVVHSKLICNVHSVSSGDKIEDLERITSIVIVLVEKGGRLEHIDIPRINAALDLAEPLLERMMCSEHKVAYMRHLEYSLMATVKSGYSDMIATLDIDGLDLVRRIVLRKVKPCLRMDLEYRVLPLSSDPSMPFEYEAVRERIPWCQELTNRDLQQFQMAAAFEWLLDLIQANDVPPNSSQLGTEALLKYALTRNPADLPFDPLIVRFPYGLLEWYGRIIATNSFLGKERDWEQRLGFLEILKEREMARQQGVFPLPAFDEWFRDFHFNKLQPKKLDIENSFASVSTVLRCRCYYEDIGSCTRFKLMRITQRMSSIDSETWKSRVKEYSAGFAGFEGKLSNWKELATGSRKDLQHISILAQLLSDTETPEMAFLLAHPKNLGDILVEPVTANSTAGPPSDNSGLATLKPDYRPLDTKKFELRFLKLNPPPSTTGNTPEDLIECGIEQYSISPNYHTKEYHKFIASAGSKSRTPMEHYRGWIEASGKPRFTWGDFNCLSYTWGDSTQSKKILLDGKPVTVGANLEAALRSLRSTKQHRDGILLWVDALCINQDDMDEKAKLVNQMYNIYRAARTVTVWLGAADPDTSDLVNRVHNFISTYTRMDEPEGSLQQAKLLKCPPIWYSTTILPAVIHLFDRPYWKRLWVMQEITASAPCEGFYVGGDVISWNEMLLLIRHHRNLTDLHKATDEFTEVQLGRAFSNLSHTRRLMAMAEMYHTSPGISHRNISLEFGSWTNWISLGGGAHVTDERDRVYGLLGLLSPKISSMVQVRYSVTAATVFRDFSRVLVEATEEFDDVLAGNIWDQSDGCSWAINLGKSFNRRVINTNATGEPRPYDLQEATDERGYEPYVPPTKRLKPKFSFSDDSTVLSMWCLHADSIEGISGFASRHPQVNIEWKQPTRPLLPGQQSSERESLLRILYADGEKTDDPDSTLLDIPWYDDAEPDAPMIEQLQNNGWWDIIQMDNFRAFHEFRRQKGDFITYNGAPFSSFFPRTGAPCTNKEKILAALGPIVPVLDSTFITTTGGQLGSTPVPAQVGDSIFIVPGCSYPVLMRLENGYHRVVGECYVEGLMKGEGVEDHLGQFEEIHCL